MGNSASVKKASFEDVLANKGLLINVLYETDQALLIAGTTTCSEEVDCVEAAIAARKPIIIYGRNTHDDRIYKKYDQVVKLGGDARVYIGGLFEWLLLQDIYGKDRFATTTPAADLLKYRPL